VKIINNSTFIIKNRTNRKINMLTFVLETSYLLEKFNELYGYDITYNNFLNDVNYYNYEWSPHEKKMIRFVDENNNIGKVYNYMLRENGKTNSFKWTFI